MLLNFYVPIYRFFSKEEHLNEMLNDGLVRFTPVKVFTNLEDTRFKDDDEGGHAFKQDTSKGWTEYGASNPKIKLVSSVTTRKRRVPDVWAFCGTSSTISSAKKKHAVRIDHLIDFMRQLDFSIEQHFGLKLHVAFGPVSYYNPEMDMFSNHEQPPYFSKTDKYKDEHEFRIIIFPANETYELQPITLRLPEPSKVFSKTLIL